jgi:6-phosphogluconate dehydrogenase
MDIGIVGLSAGNVNVARRLARSGVSVFAFDGEGRAAALADESILVAMPSAVALAHALSAPRVVWLDVASGFATEIMIQELWPELAADDVIVDASGARYQDAQRRAAALATVGIHFVDCAIAPIASDQDHGNVLVFGANPEAARIVAPYAQVLATDRGWRHCGPEGSGHLVTMILDGIDAEPCSVVSALTNEDGATPVSSLASMLQSRRAGGNTRAERLLAAMRDSFADDTVPTRDSIK